jgi:hypothetical protein
MRIPREQADRIEALQGLIHRLSAPELTLTEAKALRSRLSDLLEPGDRRVRRDSISPASPTIPSSEPGDALHPEIWSPDPSMRVAG